MLMLHRSLAVSALIVALCGCAEDVPITTEPGLMHDELVVAYDVSPRPATTVLLVLSDAEREAATVPAVALVRALVTGDDDADGTMDDFAWPTVRVAVVTPEWFATFTGSEPCVRPSACEVTPKVATYQWQPYGFAPTSEQPFLDNVRCLLSDDATDCIDDNAGEDADSNWSIPYMPVTGDLLATMATTELLALDVLSGAFDLGPWAGNSLDRVLFQDDGRAQCELKETLPTRGPITRCDQLTDFGRALDHIDDNGHEVCAIGQLPPDHGDSTPDGHGFYFYDGDNAPRYGLLPFANRDPEYTCKNGVYPLDGPHILMSLGTPFVPQSIINLRCALGPSDAAQ